VEKPQEHLVDCAAQLFLQNGYNATGINDILSKAGVSKGSFYFYFVSKKELAVKVADFYSQSKISEISKTVEGRTWEHLINKLTGIFTDVFRRSGIFEEKAGMITEQHVLVTYDGYLLFYRISKNISELEKLRRDLKASATSL
jgi:AcrR family transcriptional regulator